MLKINFKAQYYEVEIKNIDDYYFKGLCKGIIDNNKFDENLFIKYLKIPKINDYLYIKRIMNEWINFNICIFNLKIIKSLYNTFSEKQNNSFFLDDDELTNILNNK